MKQKFKIARKIVLAVVVVALANVQAMAQDASKITSALNTLVTQLKSIFSSVTSFIFAVAAIIGIIGAIIVYSKFSNGDPNATKAATAWGGAVLFLILGGVFLKAAFGM
ncbi:MAG: DUF4134 domain-containing protein [Prevotellaceae bacterium]|jgi:hypothetical protein|nr:DUF4134 domain-containing protein [Prevotellaceae bacterium]